ncbi:MAG: hypothetical protein VR65_07635 [Desulfobulbaceae bacterium BRH_c16a]|nr:MAG: hypothetical protein VR65_07635 [Desulfobulbaceae bacterium BRH_c16a]
MPLILMSILFIGGTHVAASGDSLRYHESGALTSIENNDTAIINDRGYMIAPSVLVVDAAGMQTSLDKLTIPTEIKFEYSYMKSAPKTMSPTIVFIEEKKSSTERSKQ